MIKRSLKRSTAKHWNICVKVIHCWREGQTGKTLHAIWLRKFGKERADLCAGRLPTRPLKGRWGTSHMVKKLILIGGRAELPDAFEEAVMTSKRWRQDQKQRQQGEPPQGEPEEELGTLDHTESFDYKRRKAGKWANEAVQGVKSASFWILTCIGFFATEPADHLMNWLIKKGIGWSRGGGFQKIYT